MSTGCGETTEERAAAIHGVIGILLLVVVTLETIVAGWHLWSVGVHRRRAVG